MRDFVIWANKPLQPGFSLNDLPGAGRADLLARCVNAGLWLSHGVRDDAAVHISVESNGERLVISFFGGKIRRVSPDERNIGSWLKMALECLAENKERVQEGVTVKKKDFLTFIKSFAGRDIIILKEDGTDIRSTTLKNPVFILGDHLDLPEDIMAEIKKLKVKEVSVGSVSLLASHAITVANNEMDRLDGPEGT